MTAANGNQQIPLGGDEGLLPRLRAIALSNGVTEVGACSAEPFPEVKAAIEQLKDVGRFSIFATLVILPGGVVSLLGLELLARRFGIRGFNLIPSSFRKRKRSNLPVQYPDSKKN